MLGIDVVHDEGDVTVAVAEFVGLGPVLVDCQLDLEIGLGIAQVDQGEGLEIETIGDLEPKACP